MSNIPPQQPSPYGTPPVQAQPQQGKSNTMIILIILGALFGVMLLCGGVLIALLLPAVGAARQAAQRMQRSNNMKQVGLGIHNYHAAYKQLPFTVVTDSNGEELCGWRLGISPFVEGQRQWETVMENYTPGARDLVASDAPMAFQANDAAPGETHIFAIVSPEGMFPPTPNTKVAFRDTLDGLSNTAMLIELPNRTTNWTSSQNVTPDEAFQALQALEGPEVGHLLMGDGAVIAIVPDIDRELFDALITRDGKEQINSNFGF
ncbi:MAG: DUF1559 domain-containing protein [Rubripirellula sp.]